MWKQAESRGEAEKAAQGDRPVQKTEAVQQSETDEEALQSHSSELRQQHYSVYRWRCSHRPKGHRGFRSHGSADDARLRHERKCADHCGQSGPIQQSSSVGKPMPQTEVKIVDPDEDGIGEVACKGPSVMMGYYDNPEATAEVLRDGWLYTGDLGIF